MTGLVKPTEILKTLVRAFFGSRQIGGLLGVQIIKLIYLVLIYTILSSMNASTN